MKYGSIAAGVAALAALALGGAGKAEQAVSLPAAVVNASETGPSAVAVFAGGCFWGMEAVFERVKGVSNVVSGYAGGTAQTATYDQVTTETTRHAEAIRITYDPRTISYARLLQVYFSVAHDPTQLNRQGPDTGPSYRSAIFPQSPTQAKAARAYIAQLTAAKRFARPIVTQIEQGQFFAAESYHQDFYRRNPVHPYIVRFDKPKVAAYRAAFPSLYSEARIASR